MSGVQAKRIRGWKLEAERQSDVRQAPAVEDEGHSALATKLLSLWASGALSAKAAQELAHLALLDGAEHEELTKLASCGSWGAFDGNIHRDLLRQFCADVNICDSFDVTVPCRDPKTSEVEHQPMALFLPHMMFSSLSGYDEFSNVFATHALRSFWEKVQHSQDPKLEHHPCRAGQRWEELCIPLFVHGDGVEFQDRDSMLVFSWGSILSTRSSQDSSLLIAGYPKSCTLSSKKAAGPDTWKLPMQWVTWSLEALQQGRHPTVDPFGQPFTAESPFYKHQGALLHPKGYKGIVWCFEGDQEYFANVLKLPHWGKHQPCWECDADITRPLKTWKVIRPETQQWVIKDHTASLANPASNHIFFSLTGVSTKHVQHDLLHVVFTKGILAHLFGSILHLCCWHEGPGIQRLNPERRLALIFQEIQSYYCEHRTTTRLTNLKLSMFTNPDKPHIAHPFFGAKAGECKHLLRPMLQVCEKALGGHVVGHDCMQAVRSMAELVDLYDRADVVPTSQEYEAALGLCHKFLDHYANLNEWAASQGTLLFHIVGKFHMFYHLVLSSKHLNPRYAWCFKAEDYVGKIAKVAHSVSMGVKATRLSIKVSLKYRHLLHLRLTRGDFDDISDAS